MADPVTTTPATVDADGGGLGRALLGLLILAIAFAIMGRAGSQLAAAKDDELEPEPPPPPFPDDGNGGHHGIEPEWIEAAQRAKRARADADAADPSDPSAL
jgi:hypothetical protein